MTSRSIESKKIKEKGFNAATVHFDFQTNDAIFLNGSF